MPGIVGMIGKASPQERKAALAAMLKPMQHEPFYTSGCLQEDRLELGVGWTTHKGSFSDCLPIWNENHDICLIFWGDHFAEAAEFQELKAAGHACADASTAAYLVHLYEEKGADFLKWLNGTFHGLVLDLRVGKVALFNDRYGLGRIYYHETPDAFYFGAEAKSLLRVVPQLRRLDMQSLGEFFSCGCALQNRTLFRGVALLPPGSAWTFHQGQPIRKQTYFQKTEWESLPQLSAEDYYQQLKETFTRILPRYFNGKQPVALSLTGGLDSRMILAAAPNAPGTLPCFTFGGTYRDCEDVKISRQVARLCQQPHSTIIVNGELFSEFPEQARRCVYITDGAMDVSGAIGIFVNRQARQFGLVRMTGNYGSEILRGNLAFKADYVSESIFDSSFAAMIRLAAETYAVEKEGHRLSFIAFRQVPWHHYCRFAGENCQLTIRSPYLDNELVPLAYQAPAGLLLHKQLALRYCSDLKPALAGAPTDRGMLDRPALVPERVYQLWKERWPRLEYYFDYGMPQWLAKTDRILSPFQLEKYFLGQQKFYHFRTWYRHQLAGTVREVLLDSATLRRSYLNARRVEQMVKAHTSGTGNYTTEIHKLLTAEMIERHLIAQS